jgi:hypothetical protein
MTDLPERVIVPCEHGVSWKHPIGRTSRAACPGSITYRIDTEAARAWFAEHRQVGLAPAFIAEVVAAALVPEI